MKKISEVIKHLLIVGVLAPAALIVGFYPIYASAATLSISPVSGTFEVGDRITMSIVVSSDTPINAISGSVSFPNSLFSIESISKAGSVINFWVSEPNFSQGAGLLQFEGVALNGFRGGTGTVVTTTLRALKVGSGTVSFKSGQILANDGQGTDVTNSLGVGTFLIQAKKETPQTPKIFEPEKSIEPDGSEAFQQTPTLESPEIALTKKFGEQAILGNSNYAQAKVLLTFIAESGVKVFITGVTDGDGKFLLLVPQTLKRGTYQVSAVVIQEDTTHSFTSNEITIVIGNLFSDIGLEIRFILVLLVIVVVYSLARINIYLQKSKKLRSNIKRETKEAEDVVRKSFKILSEDIDNKTNKKELKKDLDEAEGLIKKEINDIEKS